MRHTRRHVLKVALNALLLASAPAVASVNPAGGEEVWVLLNPEKQRLQVMRGAKAIVLYNNVSWGRGGVGLKTRVGDNVTPIGEFRVRWINEDSRFRTFFGFDYPTPQYAQLGLLRGDLDDQQYGRIIEARRSGDVPLQNTRLGGALGIHGIGNGDAALHNATNWTQGCIALNNDQIDHLAQYIKVGTRVVIKP